MKLSGKESEATIKAAYNYANSLLDLKRFEEGKSLLRENIPVARRVLGDSFDLTLAMMQNYAVALYGNTAAALDDLREALTLLEEIERTTRRVFGGTHPRTMVIETVLQNARTVLHARETPSSSA